MFALVVTDHVRMVTDPFVQVLTISYGPLNEVSYLNAVLLSIMTWSPTL